MFVWCVSVFTGYTIIKRAIGKVMMMCTGAKNESETMIDEERM